MSVEQWLDRSGRPNRLASLLNRGWAFIQALGSNLPCVFVRMSKQKAI